MKHTLTLLTALLLAPLAPLHAADAPKQRPNILHIHADDHRPGGLHALGTPVLHTPNLDQLVEQGMTFTRCYTMGSMVSAVCAPSRAMLLTGRSWLRIPNVNAPGDPSNFLPRVMAAAGYQTWHMGKSGEVNAFGPGLKAFEIHIVDEGHGNDAGTDRSHCSQRLADRAIEFLNARSAKEEQRRPFYMYLAPPVPHDPRTAESRFHQLYDAETIPLTPSFLPLHPFDNGDMAVRDERLAPWPRTPEDTKRQLADYYACITGLDHHVGRIFEQLKKSGQWGNTIVIFTGDNGLSMGDHGLFGKQSLYEFGGMHVPFVIAGPGIPHGRSDALVYLMDLFPTLAEIGGVMVPKGIDGISLMPVIKGAQPKVRDLLYTGYKNCQRAIRDDRWKLIRYPLVNKTQLFDLQNDPHELNNLADQPENADKVAEMMEKLQAEMKRYDDTSPLTVPDPQPAGWTPPVGDSKPARKAKKKSAAANTPDAVPAPAAAAKSTKKVRVDSNLHFTNWDTNRDGFLTLEEFKLGQKKRKELDATFKSYDNNGDGKLTREEYVDPRVLPAPKQKAAEPTDGDDRTIQNRG